MNVNHLIIVPALALFLCPSETFASPITIDPNTALQMTAADSRDPSGNGVIDVYRTTDPNTDVVRTLAQGDASVTTTTKWQDLGDTHTFDFSFEMRRSTVFGIVADSYPSELRFTATQNATYEINGQYGMVGEGRLVFRSRLQDLSIGVVTLLDNVQDSMATLNESFVLGGMSADSTNRMDGSLSGRLIKGHSYRFNYYAFTSYRFGNTLGAEAAGTVNLTIRASDDTSAVPVSAPTTTALLVLGLIGAGFSRRRTH